VLGHDSSFCIASRFREHALERNDHPHFTSALGILSQLSATNMPTQEQQVQQEPLSPDQKQQQPQQKPHPNEHDLVCASRSVLETIFARVISTVPVERSHRSAAAVRVGVINYVSHLANSRAIRTTAELRPQLAPPIYLDGLPLWPLLYYCLRCGSPAAALELVNLAYIDLDRSECHFRYYLDEFIHGRARRRAEGDAEAEGHDRHPPVRRPQPERDPESDDITRCVPGSLVKLSTHHSLVNEYDADVFTSNDPYRRACYVLLSRMEIKPASAPAVELTAHRVRISGVAGGARTDGVGDLSLRLRDEDYDILFDSVEDYFWLRMWLCRTRDEEEIVNSLPGGQFVVLPQIQSDVVSLGARHFDPHGQHPLMYAFILLTTGLLWQSVEFLATRQSPVFSAYAAYLALPIHAMKWSPGVQEYASVVWAHVIHFAADYPAEAALCVFSVRDRSSLLTCLHKLVLDTGAFVNLLGNGKHVVGAIEGIGIQILDANVDYLDGEDLVAQLQSFKREVAAAAATDLGRSAYLPSSLDRGAVVSLLYSIAGDFEHEQSSIIRRVADHVAIRDNRQTREDALQAGQKLLDSDAAMPEARRRSLGTLLRMADFFDSYWAGEVTDAWGLLSSMNVLPLAQIEIRERQVALKSSSNVYDASILSLIPHLMRAALDIAEICISGTGDGKRKRGGRTPGFSGGIGPRVPEAMALITFAGLMGFAETELNARLVRLELLLS
jgi:hypothetical protein